MLALVGVQKVVDGGSELRLQLLHVARVFQLVLAVGQRHLLDVAGYRVLILALFLERLGSSYLPL